VTWTGVTLHEDPSLRLQVPVSALRNASPVAARMVPAPRLRHCGRGAAFLKKAIHCKNACQAQGLRAERWLHHCIKMVHSELI